ncbi:proteasome lid subunit RPN8/RPN11 [Mobilisporobacter senegalensis]|uniref:Proteasome lid subunit RPN8/RPN11 n=1 Tax=Mobilisporobacter senegalensis TaxID=1329262 RepID=A0A3N1XQ41_9FIRM|nr:M67 family metallopeptidase [Mobilisporobacter senegalensis]ROR28291.1 proteasome lid subunit RPN8/RPN11 [Mobilisporobacter senegalensis]
MLFLRKKDYELILEHALNGLPNEACGLIAGVIKEDKKYIEKVYLLTNIDVSREHFSMDPKEQLAVLKDIRANNYVLLGNFHSHPETPARPSKEDKRLAYDSKINYLILSLMNPKQPVLKAFLIQEGKDVSEEVIEIV